MSEIGQKRLQTRVTFGPLAARKRLSSRIGSQFNQTSSVLNHLRNLTNFLSAGSPVGLLCEGHRLLVNGQKALEVCRTSDSSCPEMGFDLIVSSTRSIKRRHRQLDRA